MARRPVRFRHTSRDAIEREIAAWRDATNETAPKHLWRHAVEITAVRKGAPSEALRSERIRAIMHRAYVHGEPVWMAADEVAFVAKAITRPQRTPREELRAALALHPSHPSYRGSRSSDAPKKRRR